MESTVAKVAVYIYLYSVQEMYVKQYTVVFWQVHPNASSYFWRRHIAN